MVTKVCVVCKRTNSENSSNVVVSMFAVPRERERLNLWKRATGVVMTEISYICSRHFSDSAFKIVGKSPRLKSDALPTLQLGGGTIDSDDLHIKSEPKQQRELAFINEDSFDENLLATNMEKSVSFGKTCDVCGAVNNEPEQNPFFTVAQDSERLALWKSLIGDEFTITGNSCICAKHFDENAFQVRGGGIRLKNDAVPSLSLCKKSATVEADSEDFPRIKSEPDEQQEQGLLTLINEELFDERFGTSVTKSDRNGRSKACNTRHCGIVDLFTMGSIKEYKLKCISCSRQFPMKEWKHWKDFTEHIESEHKTSQLDKVPDELPLKPDFGFMQNVPEFVEPICIQTELETPILMAVNATKKEDKTIDDDFTNEENDSDSGGVSNSYAHSASGANENDDDDGLSNRDDTATLDKSLKSDELSSDNESIDPDFEVQKKKLRQKTKSSSVAGDPVQSKRSKKSKAECDQITFDSTDAKIVKDFLVMLKDFPILWHRRQGAMKLFDAAITELSIKFNEKYSEPTLSEAGLRETISRFKVWHRHNADKDNNKKPNSKTRSSLKMKFPEYYHLCCEIEEASKKIIHHCTHCAQYFFSNVDLQVHCVKFHRVGELPFKCQRCNYGFATAARLAEHEQKHDRKKSFFCEICNQGFYYASMLSAHMTTHTDDHMQVCEICGKKFPTPSKYRRHKLHHDEPKEKCELCGKSFFEKWTLSEHMKSHRNERQYKCDICGKTFNRQEGVTIHKRGVHKIKTGSKYVWAQRTTANTHTTQTSPTTMPSWSADLAKSSMPNIPAALQPAATPTLTTTAATSSLSSPAISINDDESYNSSSLQLAHANAAANAASIPKVNAFSPPIVNALPPPPAVAAAPLPSSNDMLARNAAMPLNPSNYQMLSTELLHSTFLT